MHAATLDTLPSISSARLPATYEAAARALAECSRIDECQQWADKAEALASYAKQSKDESLRKMADRIQARAIRRCGELLKQIEPSKGGQPTHDGGGISRTKAAQKAGLSERQKVTALRVASIPQDDFDYAVESQDPPTVTALADRGKKLVDLGVATAHNFAAATHALATLRRFAEFCSINDPAEVAAGVQPKECRAARANVTVIDSWLDRFVTQLTGE